MHRVINSFCRLIHQTGGAIHNLKKFFAFAGKKYTPVVQKDLFLNILLSKKENITRSKKKSPRDSPEG
ncbi:MAG TPA: hypothetical protein DIC22_02500 [Chitinophagaceae bacterium]|jgi:hypothetical protein|nr:hypothetical protein [Chitinophagaceae bacterium]